jgi:aryl-alcohol dehydrogenase-like predicted oxidoreductase
MEQRRLGKTGMQVSVLGFGASEIGYEDASLATVERLLGSALDAGLNLIDTAACYADSEALIGQAVGHRRKDYCLLTKCGHDGDEFGLADWAPALIGKSIERSLRRLRTDYLDVVQLHTCEEATLRQGDVVAELQRARDRGLTRHIGYSGDSMTALAAVKTGAFDTLQISVNIADQEAIERVLPVAIDRDLGIIAKRPIANAAWLTSRYAIDSYARPYAKRLRKLRYPFLKRGAGERQWSEAERANESAKCVPNDVTGATELTPHLANSVAPRSRGQIKSAAESVATALRFTLTTPGIHTAIVGTKQPSRWEQNAALAAQGPLSAAEYDTIRQRWREVASLDWVGQR